MTKRTYEIVGHRGFPQKYPENSLVGLVAAAEAGVDCIELDVQVSKDGTLVVFHDAILDRVTETKGSIWEYSASQLANISCHEPSRFSDKFLPTPIVSLGEVCKVLSRFDVHVFIEVKKESLEHVDRSAVLLQLQVDVEPLSRYSLISFDFKILEMAKGKIPIGWVLRTFDEKTKYFATELEPNILIVDVKKISRDAILWRGPWDWFLYDIVDLDVAVYWSKRGVRYIETWDLEALK